eukprot:CAMPEP_0116881294 /NCGR_PEP_ID=MMETSP0463-20121206/13423_1 /TAXON_ID=181622 /ORGANISM="Strombidinopsis sp, Strain SopsisLIS2011" /LENGTH=114 /DNA_ID=CAMNT_0004533129 /DNA_START=87 /DNA_END=431 /DNA_ORIENTATION=+
MTIVLPLNGDLDWSASSFKENFPTYILEFYYGFFALFMLGVSMKIKVLIKYCGFINGYVFRTFFYAFLSSLALAHRNNIISETIGYTLCGFTAISVIRMIRLCRGPPVEEEASA